MVGSFRAERQKKKKNENDVRVHFIGERGKKSSMRNQSEFRVQKSFQNA